MSALRAAQESGVSFPPFLWSCSKWHWLLLPCWAGRGEKELLVVQDRRRLGGDGGKELIIDLTETLDSFSAISKTFNEVILNSTFTKPSYSPGAWLCGCCKGATSFKWSSGSAESEQLGWRPGQRHLTLTSLVALVGFRAGCRRNELCYPPYSVPEICKEWVTHGAKRAIPQRRVCYKPPFGMNSSAGVAPGTGLLVCHSEPLPFHLTISNVWAVGSWQPSSGF